MTAKRSTPTVADQVGGRPPRRRVAKVFTMPSKTKPSEGQLTDINHIVRHYSLDELAASRAPIYADTTSVPRLEEALEIVARANTVLEMQPADVRKAADHNVELFYEMLSTENGRAVLSDAGLPVAAPGTPGAVEALSGDPAATGGEAGTGHETGISPSDQPRADGQEGTAS